MELRRKQEGRCPVINETPHVFWASGRQAARRRRCCCLGPAAPARCRNCSAPTLPPGRLPLLSGPRAAGARGAPLLGSQVPPRCCSRPEGGLQPRVPCSLAVVKLFGWRVARWRLVARERRVSQARKLFLKAPLATNTGPGGARKPTPGTSAAAGRASRCVAARGLRLPPVFN